MANPRPDEQDQQDQGAGDLIRAAREAQGLTRKQAAEALGINDQYLYQVETGRRIASLETLWEIADYLGLDPHALDSRLATREIKKLPRWVP